MKWSVESIEKLKNLCLEEKSNKEIAEILGCSLNDVYAKRSQLGITIDKCKKTVIEQKPKIKRKGLNSEVKKAFKVLQDRILLTLASDWTSEKEANLYAGMSNILAGIETSFDDIIKQE